MFDHFTDRARKVMSLARMEALRSDRDYIGTEHILLGLVLEGSGVAANVLENMCADLKRVKSEVEKVVVPDTGQSKPEQLHFTPCAKTVLVKSQEAARELGHKYVGTEHLLLGLLATEEGLAAQTLLNLGLTLEEVRKKVVNFLGTKRGSPNPIGSRSIPPILHYPESVKDGSSRKRPWFKVHLGTAVVLMLVAGALVWANMRPQRELVVEGLPDLPLYSISRGWPTTCHLGGINPDNPNKEPRGFQHSRLLLNALVALAILTAVAVGCEYLLCRREKAVKRGSQ